ncbi:MAG: hypothetical protein AAF199_04765 [Pseudomonadota bacterium]
MANAATNGKAPAKKAPAKRAAKKTTKKAVQQYQKHRTYGAQTHTTALNHSFADWGALLIFDTACQATTTNDNTRR